MEELEPVLYESKDENRNEKLKLIGLIMDLESPTLSLEKAGALFDKLYDKSLFELKIYYQVFK